MTSLLLAFVTQRVSSSDWRPLSRRTTNENMPCKTLYMYISAIHQMIPLIARVYILLEVCTLKVVEIIVCKCHLRLDFLLLNHLFEERNLDVNPWRKMMYPYSTQIKKLNPRALLCWIPILLSHTTGYSAVWWTKLLKTCKPYVAHILGSSFNEFHSHCTICFSTDKIPRMFEIYFFRLKWMSRAYS